MTLISRQRSCHLWLSEAKRNRNECAGVPKARSFGKRSERSDRTRTLPRRQDERGGSIYRSRSQSKKEQK